MSKFNQIEGFKNYEISETRTVIRNAKTKAIISFEKSGSIRLVNDNKERITLNKEQISKLSVIVPESAENTEIPEPEKTEEQKQETEGPKPAENKPAEKPKLVLRKPKQEKPKKEKKRKKEIEVTPEIKKILDGDGSKASKMKSLFQLTKSIKSVSVLLKTHYSYVYNHLVFYPKKDKK